MAVSVLASRPPAPPPGLELSGDRAVSGVRGSLLIASGLLQIGAIALLDHATGPHLCCSIFYIAPVAVGAWYGGLPVGVLLALAGSIAWHQVELLEVPAIGPTVRVWNGIVRFGTLALVCSLVTRLHAGLRRERRLARTDPLTGAANARTFYEAAAAEAERALAARWPLTLAYLDLDDFKRLNDRLGHAAGDEALKFLVRLVQHGVREGDLLARLGGDEFALLLPGTGPDEASALLRRLQAKLASGMAARSWPVTLSAGAITFLRPAWGVDRMVQEVDALMYGAKRQGKGRVECAVISGDAPDGGRQGVERRASTRLLCGGAAARVRQEGGPEACEGQATVRDISAWGVGLLMGDAMPEGVVLVIEPLSPSGRTLLGRVVRVVRERGGWLHGCLLSSRLSQEEIDGWLEAARGQ